MKIDFIDSNTEKKFSRIADAARLAAVIEASSEKPGNVTPTYDFHDTTYEDYLAGSIAIGESIREAASRGYMAGKKQTTLSEIGVGCLIFQGICDVKKSHSGGNTHLGILMMYIPIAAASGLCISSDKGFSHLRKNVKKVMENTTLDDSLDLYAAIKECNAGGIGQLIEEKDSLINVMKKSAAVDRIAAELSNGMKIVFTESLPFFEEKITKSRDFREAVTETYLHILSKYPDTLIAKKYGIQKAEKVSEDAGKVLSGIMSKEEFDKTLRDRKNMLNPGTTADLIATTVFLMILKRIIR